MNEGKIFFLTYALAFFLTAFLCILGGYPLIFEPASYEPSDFIIFGVLVLTLSFGLVYITLPFLRYLRRPLKMRKHPKWFYVTGSLLILQLLTGLLGFIESYYHSNESATPLYYYQGVGNSLIYITTGNITAIIAALLYADSQTKAAEKKALKFGRRRRSSRDIID